MRGFWGNRNPHSSLFLEKGEAGQDTTRARLVRGGALFGVIIVHHETRMDDPRYPTEHRQNDA